MNLIVTDFDGTFYDKNYDKNIELIKKYNNIDFVIATGRNFTSLKKDLKINCKYYICNDGGYILDNNYNLLYRNSINKETVKTIHSRIIELGYDYFFDNINTFSKDIVNNINKISIKIKDNNAEEDMKYILNELNDVYAYISTNWINILSIDSKKGNAIDYISKLNNYKNIYVVGNDINDYDMLKKYNGYFISKKESNNFNTIKCFLELKNIIKND
ncbi:MAG: hypothetical protein E7174_01735 [Firmicutes bacterium]|nr:hypothetical protein [Bacillota bacterium]